jgi:hypothetical protein
LERYFDKNGNPKSSTATEEAPAPRPVPRTEAENEGRIGAALGNDAAAQERRAKRLAGVLAGASAGAQERPPEEKAPEPVKAQTRRARPKAKSKPSEAETKPSTPQPEPAEIAAARELLQRHQEDNTLDPNSPAQSEASARIRAYEAEQNAEKRAAQDAAATGAPPKSTGGTAGGAASSPVTAAPPEDPVFLQEEIASERRRGQSVFPNGDIKGNSGDQFDFTNSPEYRKNAKIVQDDLDREAAELPRTPESIKAAEEASEWLRLRHDYNTQARADSLAQSRTATAKLAGNPNGSIAATDQSILDYYKEFPPDNDADRALVKEIQDRANGRNPEKVAETDPRLSGPVPAGADAKSSLNLQRIGDVPTLGDFELAPLEDWRDTTRLETDYSARGVAIRAREAQLKANEKEYQASIAAENAKRKAAADGNKANWFEANRRINSTGFSGCDITALVRVPNRGRDGFNEERIFNIGTLQTISISTYNSKTPVRALGFKNPVSIARGGRTIAGTMIFNQLHTHVLDESDYGSLTSVLDKNGLLSYSSGVNVTIYNAKDVNTSGMIDPTVVKNRKKVWDFSWDTTLNRGQFQKPSDIIPFDIVIWMINESGGMGKIILYDIDIIHDSTTLSVEDIYTEVQYQYMARDIEYFEAYNIDQAYEWQGVTLPNVVTRKVMEEDIVDPTAENYGESA